MTLPLIIVLAVIQGVTEFLPVSSSGHLVAYEELLSNKELSGAMMVTFTIATHIGTLLAVLAVYRREIIGLLSSQRGLIVPICVATIPAVVIGLGLKQSDVAGDLMNPLLVGCMLIVTGVVLWYGDTCGSATASELDDVVEYGRDTKVSIRQALIIGLCQAFAILPGISRSGVTIVGGNKAGLSRKDAATFSFLMAIPVILGAGILESIDVFWGESAESAPNGPINMRLLLISIAVSGFVGFFALRWLVRWIERGRLSIFSYWCIPLGVLLIVLN